MRTFLPASFFVLALVMPSFGSASGLKPADSGAFVIGLLPGHTVYHEHEQEAGVITAISITPGQHDAGDLTSPCEDLRLAAGLEHSANGGGALEVLFVVPYKGMAIEGYYFPAHDGLGSEVLVPGNGLAREVLDDIVSRAGVPAGVLDEIGVEQQVSCALNEPAWHVRWEDIRSVDGEKPDIVIERAHQRFMTIYQSVLDHSRVAPVSVALH